VVNEDGDLPLKDLAVLVAHSLSRYGIEAVLSGGACVTLYTNNRYISGDLDFVTDTIYEKKIGAAMEEIGFKLMPEKYFRKVGCKYFVEFVPAPLSVGKEPVKDIARIRTKKGVLKLLSPTDSVKDRLAAFFHWNDRQSLDQAVMVSRSQKVDLIEIMRWSANEGYPDKYKEFLDLLNTQ